MKKVQLVGISGSLRKKSYNTQLLHNVKELLPEQAVMEIVSIENIPLYNADLDLPAASERPAAVQAFRDQLAKADAFVICSPEYNYSIPGGLKNAIDWASRGKDSPLTGKPVALMGTTPGLWGTVRMQMAFLPVFVFMDMPYVQMPEVLIANAEKKFDDQGKLTDEEANKIIRKKIDILLNLVAKKES